MDSKDTMAKARAGRSKNKIKKKSKPTKSCLRKPGEVLTMKAAIRSFCIICFGGGSGEKTPSADIRNCTSYDCNLYPYRLGGLDAETITEEMETKGFIKRDK